MPHARQHAQHAAEPAHLLQLAELIGEIVEIELALLELGGHLLGLLALHRLGGALDQADDVAHAEDAAGDAVGMEILQRIQLLADADQLDRAAGDGAHGKRGTAARIAIDPGQHDAGQLHPVAELGRDIDRVLAGHGIDHQQGLGGRGCLMHGRRLGHQLLVHMQAAGGIEHDHVMALEPAGLERAPGDGDRRLARDDGQGRHLRLAAEHGQLLLGRGPAGIEGGHQHALALAGLQAERDLGGGGRLARALEPDHHHDDGRRGVEIDADAGPAQGLDQRVMDDLHHHLAGGDALEHALADGLLAHRGEEVADHRQGDIGLEQGHAHLAQRRIDIGLGQRAAPRQPPEDIAQPFCQLLEHRQPIAANSQNAKAPVRETRGRAGPLGTKRLAKAEAGGT